jgi:hypothetical protein
MHLPGSAFLNHPSNPNQCNQGLLADGLFRFRRQNSLCRRHTDLLREAVRDDRQDGIGAYEPAEKESVKGGVLQDEPKDRSHVREGSDQWRISQAPSLACMSFHAPMAEEAICHGADSARSVPAHESAARIVGDAIREVFPTGVA